MASRTSAEILTPILVFILVSPSNLSSRTDRYTYREAKMSLSDKIVQTLKEFRSLSSEGITQKLQDNYSIGKTRRTIQRHINALLDKNVIKLDSPVGREQTYSLTGTAHTQNQSLSAFFVNNFWKQLETIRLNNIEREPSLVQRARGLDLPDYSLERYRELCSLIRTLPLPIKRKLHSKIEEYGSLIEKERNIDERIKKARLFIDNLVDAVSTLFHDYMTEGRNEP